MAVTAIFIMVMACALVAVTSLLAKTLGLPIDSAPALNPLQVSAGRFFFALCALGVFLSLVPAARPRLASNLWHWHILRSLCGWLGVTCMFAAVSRMPIADATAIAFLSPVVTVGLASLMLGEKIGARTIFAAALAIAGALLILQPGTQSFQLAGLFALAAALLMGLESIFIKRLSDAEPALRILVINNSIGALVSLLAASFVWIWPTLLQWVLLLVLGTVMVSAQALVIQSMKRGEASLVIPAFYSVLVFVAVLDFIVYSVMPTTFTYAGSALIVSAALLLALQKT